MTTICWDGRYLAADRRHRTGEQWHFEGCKFITSERAGVWYTSTGTSAVVEAWAAWADAGADPYGMLPRNDLEGHQGGLIRLSGECVHMLDYRVPYWTWAGNSWAWGSGADFALAAMACGKNAMEAVDVAAMLDPATGDGVDYIDHSEPVLGVQRWDGRTPYVHGGTASWVLPSPGGVVSGEATAPSQATITIAKPAKLRFAGTEALHQPWSGVHVEERWAEIECDGRLLAGTGCGHCLRCNREWHALLRGPHERLGDGTTIKIDGWNVGEHRKRANQRQAEAESAYVGGVKVSDAVDAANVKAFQDEMRMPPQSSTLIASAALAALDRATVERWCERWNAASKADNKPLMAKLETELRGVKFPEGVALEWSRDAESAHGRQTVVDAPKAE